MTQIGAGGEEWKAMDQTTRPYQPDESLIARSKQSIEKIRKQDVVLKLTDRAGKPLANTVVQVVQKRNAFCFGSSVARQAGALRWRLLAVRCRLWR